MILNLLNKCGMVSNFLIKSGGGSCPHILHLKCSLRNSVHTHVIQILILATVFTSDSMYMCIYVCMHAHHKCVRTHTHTHSQTQLRHQFMRHPAYTVSYSVVLITFALLTIT